jgi:hypothetical protein
MFKINQRLKRGISTPCDKHNLKNDICHFFIFYHWPHFLELYIYIYILLCFDFACSCTHAVILMYYLMVLNLHILPIFIEYFIIKYLSKGVRGK